MSSPRLIAAYRRSQYRVGGATIGIGARSAMADDILRRAHVREATLIGAWNPFSRRMPAGWNRHMDTRLRDHLNRHRWLEADGGAGGWREAHALVLGDARPALVLARRFRQRAVVVLRRGQKARLVMVSPPPASPRTAAGTAAA